MAKIKLNKTETFINGATTKYWREIQCEPQTVELQTWSTNHPLFYLKGTVVKSHDPKEIGIDMDVCYQGYSFRLEEKVKDGVFTIQN